MLFVLLYLFMEGGGHMCRLTETSLQLVWGFVTMPWNIARDMNMAAREFWDANFQKGAIMLYEINQRSAEVKAMRRAR